MPSARPTAGRRTTARPASRPPARSAPRGSAARGSPLPRRDRPTSAGDWRPAGPGTSRRPAVSLVLLEVRRMVPLDATGAGGAATVPSRVSAGRGTSGGDGRRVDLGEDVL